MGKATFWNKMTREEKSLLIYFESCAVNYSGRILMARMNDEDRAIAQRWHESEFIQFGRIKAKDSNGQGAHWVELSDEAWRLAHMARRGRHNLSKRHYKRTNELGEKP